jgi:hypothetical protein
VATKQTTDGCRVHSFCSLPADRATPPAIEFSSANKPLTGWLRRPVQQRALDLLQIRP